MNKLSAYYIAPNLKDLSAHICFRHRKLTVHPLLPAALYGWEIISVELRVEFGSNALGVKSTCITQVFIQVAVPSLQTPLWHLLLFEPPKPPHTGHYHHSIMKWS